MEIPIEFRPTFYFPSSRVSKRTSNRCAAGYFPSDVHVYFMISLKVVNILSNSNCKFDLGTNNQSSTYYAFSCADKFSQELTNKKNCVILSGVAQ